MHTNINNSLARLEPFIFTEWKFNNPKMLELHESLSPEDKKTFGLDIKTLSWEDYFIELTKGVRVYLNKEPMKNLEKARSKDTMFVKKKFYILKIFFIHLKINFVFVFFLWNLD